MDPVRRGWRSVSRIGANKASKVRPSRGRMDFGIIDCGAVKAVPYVLSLLWSLLSVKVAVNRSTIFRVTEFVPKM